MTDIGTGLAYLFSTAVPTSSHLYNAHVVSRHAKPLEDDQKDLPRANLFVASIGKCWMKISKTTNSYLKYARFLKKQ